MNQQFTKKKQIEPQDTAQRKVKSLLSAWTTQHPMLHLQETIGNHGLLRYFGTDLFQAKLKIGHPGDKYEQEADRVAEKVNRSTNHANSQQTSDTRKVPFIQGRVKVLPSIQSDSIQGNIGNIIQFGLGRPLDRTTLEFMSEQFGGFDFSNVHIHTDENAAESARSINALAYTLGHDVVFNRGQYSPSTIGGKKLLTHELAHVVQQTTFCNPRLQAFSAMLDGKGIYIKPEKGDTDADLDRVLCGRVKDRKIAGRKKIDVTECLPQQTIKGMSLGPYNCADFVRRALGETPPKAGVDYDWLLTRKLWEELLKKGYRIRGFGFVDKRGKVAQVEGLSWQQVSPRIGDVVFMRGDIFVVKEGEVPNAAGDNFGVTWDHVGFFIVRSRDGFDYHLAKDGDENPIDVYRTGSEPDDWVAPGAYVKGMGTLVAYLGVPKEREPPEMKAK